MHFGFALELSDRDLWNTDLLDTHLDLLSRDKYTGIPSKYFVCLHKIFKRSSRLVFKTSSRRLQDQQMFAGIIMVWQENNCWSLFLIKLQAFRLEACNSMEISMETPTQVFLQEHLFVQSNSSGCVSILICV